jgi:hypothetical protein
LKFEWYETFACHGSRGSSDPTVDLFEYASFVAVVNIPQRKRRETNVVDICARISPC